ncbi:thioredoxin reductase (NADPH) [Clostridium tetanomorphum]|uniref:Thioredoxin reductase n=1 Tax=Clostridium tetanomorphum TaxID=1553 RepID=A0A923J250_CLOTT|nr:thioredoxin-disulfide reductase [Clostridium tetanomorphum]KAJ53923.1 thioredoxin reductase [Clostridium tetanomorphum DSM 665]MBC2398093.1 thioredoxin-disulfide reductase [Clostridium tetanomorphum]MBP1864662.1 thioredoxin reductase (NADPH) [Clostridium tetanomorphum]NRS84132.1 thioredoxin reductase (NADPH) [Clostridium tetanomorphum]NRZ97345.1 thioredoxin reductase (NADPH) [Clostridium tetanomorphum]
MNKEEKKIDLVIIGSGPAGLTAAIYAARLKLNFIVLEDELVGGQIRASYIVENYPGFKKISGEQLINNMQEQAVNAGANIDEFDNIVRVDLRNEEKIIETENYIYKPDTVIIAAGSKYRPLPIPEEEKYHGNGIHHCELCDGQMYEGKEIIVVGGGNSALEGAIFLSRYAKTITIIHQFDHFQGEKSLQEELFKSSKVKVIWNTEIRHAFGEEKLEGVVVQNLKTKGTYKVEADGIFVYIGMIPRTDLFKDYIKLNKAGYIEADETTQTNVKGVFAAGDVRTKLFRQLTTATADGAVAALMAEKYIVEKRRNIND